MEEPKFTSLLRSAKAVEGSPIKLEGKVSGHPAPGKRSQLGITRGGEGTRRWLGYTERKVELCFSPTFALLARKYLNSSFLIFLNAESGHLGRNILLH